MLVTESHTPGEKLKNQKILPIPQSSLLRNNTLLILL
jgi:hypothetical protein